MRLAIYEEHIAIFYSVAYCPTKTPTVYRCKKHICIYYVIVEQVNKIIFVVFSQPLTPHFFFERFFFSVEKKDAENGASNGVRSVVLGFILRLRDFRRLEKRTTWDFTRWAPYDRYKWSYCIAPINGRK